MSIGASGLGAVWPLISFAVCSTPVDSSRGLFFAELLSVRGTTCGVTTEAMRAFSSRAAGCAGSATRLGAWETFVLSAATGDPSTVLLAPTGAAAACVSVKSLISTTASTLGNAAELGYRRLFPVFLLTDASEMGTLSNSAPTGRSTKAGFSTLSLITSQAHGSGIGSVVHGSSSAGRFDGASSPRTPVTSSDATFDGIGGNCSSWPVSPSSPSEGRFAAVPELMRTTEPRSSEADANKEPDA